MHKLVVAMALLVTPTIASARVQNLGGEAAAEVAAKKHYPLPHGSPVVDEANAIPDDREAALVQKILAYEKRTGHQLVVTTVKSLNGEDVQPYSVTYFRAVGIGGKDRDDGTLILVSPDEHLGWITTGRSMQAILTDADASNIWRNTIVPQFKAGDIPGGIEQGADAVMKATTPLTAAETAMQQREAAIQKQRSAAFWAGVKDFFMTILGIAGIGGVTYGAVKAAQLPAKRRREREEAAEREAQRIRDEKERKEQEARWAKEQAERRAEEERLEKLERGRIARVERERQAAIAKAARERKAMLAAMSPSERKAFLKKEEDARLEQARLARVERERREAEAVAAAAAAAAAYEADRPRREAAARRLAAEEQAERARKEKEEDAARRRRDADSSSSYGSSSSGSDFGGGWSGGGGDTGGGGAGGSW